MGLHVKAMRPVILLGYSRQPVASLRDFSGPWQGSDCAYHLLVPAITEYDCYAISVSLLGSNIMGANSHPEVSF